MEAASVGVVMAGSSGISGARGSSMAPAAAAGAVGIAASGGTATAGPTVGSGCRALAAKASAAAAEAASAGTDPVEVAGNSKWWQENNDEHQNMAHQVLECIGTQTSAAVKEPVPSSLASVRRPSSCIVA